jgi:SAM-dependent methyltransferase
MADHWNAQARQWRHIGAPLRPSPPDVADAESAVRELAQGAAQPLRAALLGVTPELAGMDWPRDTRLLAVDRCRGMIAGVWPAPPMQAWAVRGDWSRLPCESASLDAVVGDGCYTLLPYPQVYSAVTAEVARVLRPGGLFWIRLFVRPETPEPADAVFADLRAGRIGSFHAFKWRLAMALHGTLAEGVPIGQVHARWQREAIDIPALAARTGWSQDSIRTIEAYRDSPTRYHFATLAEARAHLAAHFSETGCRQYDYELGERCPVLRLARR